MGALIISLAGFLGTLGAGYGLWRLFEWRDPLKRRLRAIAQRSPEIQRSPKALLARAFDAVFHGTMRVLLEKPQGKMLGLRTPRERILLLSLLWGAALISVVACPLVALRAPIAWGAMKLAAMGWHRWHVQRWTEEINNSLIDVLDLWVLCLGSGMSFQASLVRVAQDTALTSRALRDELQLTHQEMLAGCPRDEALRRLVRRCGDLPDMRTLVAHIIQSERLGSSLAQTLKVHAASLRFNRAQDTKELIQKLPVKMAFPLVFCILPALFVVIIGPGVLRLFAIFANQ